MVGKKEVLKKVEQLLSQAQDLLVANDMDTLKLNGSNFPDLHTDIGEVMGTVEMGIEEVE